MREIILKGPSRFNQLLFISAHANVQDVKNVRAAFGYSLKVFIKE